MQTRTSTASLLAFSLVISLFSTHPAFSNDTPAPQAIGIYDSRVVSYAWFWSERGTRERNDLVASARAAKAAGDEKQFATAEAAIRALQDRNHLQVFSTAPVDEILAGIEPQRAAIMQQAGVSRLVSKWDEPTLRALAGAPQVDLTDQLVAALITPNEKQAKVIAEIKRQKPLPLERARERMREGKL